MCTPEQLEDEFKNCLELAIYMLKTLGLYDDVSYRFSQWDPDDREKYIGTQEQWDEAQGIMKRILDKLELPYEIGIGEAAFYGPKLDIQIRNGKCHGCTAMAFAYVSSITAKGRRSRMSCCLSMPG